MFGKYDKKTFNEIKSQHNIMVSFEHNNTYFLGLEKKE